MTKRLTTMSLSLSEALRSRPVFVLPASQRAYGWCEIQLDALFADSGYAAHASDATATRPDWLYLGAIYLADQADGTTAIADGQQRIVTALMIHAAARDLETDPAARADLHACVSTTTPLPGANPIEQPRLRLRDADAAFFQRWVIDDGATLKLYRDDGGEQTFGDAPPPLSESQFNILTNRNQIVEKLRSLQPDARRRFMAFLNHDTELAVITAPSVESALNAYASTLKRGLSQGITDRLKFEIIGDVPVQLRARLANHWDECEALIGKSNLEELCGLLLLNATRTAPPADVQTQLLKAFNLPAEAEVFVEQILVPATTIYRHIASGGDKLAHYLKPSLKDRARVGRMRGHLSTLLRTTHSEWRAPAIAALTHLQKTLPLLETVLAGLERLAATFMLAGHEPVAAGKRYGQLTAAIEAKDSEAIARALRVEATLKTKARDQLMSANFGSKPRYRMPVLLKLNDLAAGETTPISVKDVSCEHILPQNVGKENPAWFSVFRSANGRTYIGHNYRHRIGNMTVLSHLENRLAADKAYGAKRLIYAKSDYAIARRVTEDHDSWTMASIEARSKSLFDQLVRHWDL